MPLFNFIEVLVDDNLSFVGNAPKNILKEAWENIFSEYTSLSNDVSQNRLLILVKEITVLNNKIVLAQTIIDELAKGHSEVLGKCLNLLGFKHKYSEDSLERDLKLTVSNAKSIVLRVEQLKRDLEAIKSTNTSPKRSDFDNILIVLSKFMGYRVDSKEISVSEFIALQNRFKLENKPTNGK